MIRVLVADTSELIRIGLKTILAKQNDIELVGEAVSKIELKDKVARFLPDVVLIDYSNPAFTIDIIPEILQHIKTTRFVAITQFHTGLSIVNGIKSGVTSHIKKDCDVGEILDAVKETAKGNKFFCGTLLQMIKEESINIDEIDSDELNCAPVTISEREMEIIGLIAEGFTNQQIAEKLFLSSHTINTHRKNIMAKLGVKNTAGIVMYAIKAQLVSPNKYLFSANQ